MAREQLCFGSQPCPPPHPPRGTLPFKDTRARGKSRRDPPLAAPPWFKLAQNICRIWDTELVLRHKRGVCRRPSKALLLTKGDVNKSRTMVRTDHPSVEVEGRSAAARAPGASPAAHCAWGDVLT